MRAYRRSQLRSSRGHVRMNKTPAWTPRSWWFGAAAVVLVVMAIIVWQSGSSDSKKTAAAADDNRTWLEFSWANDPINENAIQSLSEHLKSNQINMIYVEASAWRTDGSLVESEHAADLVESLRGSYPDLKILLWLRLSIDQIMDETTHDAVLALADKATKQWGFDGVQLNGRGVISGNEAYIELLRSLRDQIGSKAILSVTVPPDRIPTDPDIPMSPATDPGLTWDLGYKQRVGLLSIDEMVLMAHASGLEDAEQYKVWVAYQVESYADILAELEDPARIIVAVPTYDTEPYHDPTIESVQVSIQGIKEGIKQAGKNGKLVQGVGLYEYKTADSLEWSLYREEWLAD